jgi:hypothetical protein
VFSTVQATTARACMISASEPARSYRHGTIGMASTMLGRDVKYGALDTCQYATLVESCGRHWTAPRLIVDTVNEL